MRKILLTVMVFLVLGSAGYAAARMRFWNSTIATITELYLAAPGTNAWGKNQCENDKDKSVDADERLTLIDVAPGTYDVKFADKMGRTCILRNVEVKDGQPYAFSIEEGDFKKCEK
ncbi:MAG: hypothetical protein WAN51_04455 [Alphaproteobacteria bacterium]